MILERLDVLNLDEEDVAWLGGLDLKWAGKVVDLGQIDILNIVGTIIVANLSACPVDAFDLDDLAVLDSAAEGDWLERSVQLKRAFGRLYRQDAIDSS